MGLFKNKNSGEIVDLSEYSYECLGGEKGDFERVKPSEVKKLTEELPPPVANLPLQPVASKVQATEVQQPVANLPLQPVASKVQATEVQQPVSTPEAATEVQPKVTGGKGKGPGKGKGKAKAKADQSQDQTAPEESQELTKGSTDVIDEVTPAKQLAEEGVPNPVVPVREAVSPEDVVKQIENNG